MSVTLAVSLVSIFICIALVSQFALSRFLSWSAPERKRLREAGTASTGVLRDGDESQLVETPIPALRQLSKTLPKSVKEMTRLRKKLAAAGYYDLSAAVYYSTAQIAAPVVCGALAFLLFGFPGGWIQAATGAAFGYLLPDLVVKRKTRLRAKAIDNGLPDALDLLIVCMEAGSSLDQSIVKASDELEITHPALAHELRLITTEIRAGKPRLEAFQNFAKRTQVDDVRSLVAMLTQTDRFGTSVAQALRTHAEVSRTKRRQRAEERAAKVGVKLVFPLVLCIFPAVYLVCIGPVVVAIYHAFFQ
jgi:tight adherence protein C